MSATIDKIKAKVDNVLHKDKTHDDPTGPHHTHAANKADPRVDSDRVGPAGNTAGAGGTGTGQYGEHHTTTGHHTTGGLTGSTGTYGHSDPTGPHDSRLANKADPRVDSDRIGTAGNTTGGLTGSTGTYGTTGHSDPTGPHDSRLANKLDPRVDSDRIGAQGNTAGAGGYGTGQYGEGHHTTGHHTAGGLTGSTGTTGTYGAAGHSDPTGPHDSRLANKLDPRVDSDRIGAQGNTSGAGGYGTGQYGEGHTTGHHTTGHGTTGGLTGGLGAGHSDPTGPHDSHLANKLDPRVDSDRYGAQGNTAGAGGYGTGQYGEGHHTTGHHTTGHGTTGGLTGGLGAGHSDPTGPHDSRLANKADPRVDSDRYGAQGNTAGAGGYGTGQYGEGHQTAGHGLTGGLGSSTVGSGTAHKTAGPHNSDLLNKVDPRVDSDLDGSKTYGGNATYQ